MSESKVDQAVAEINAARSAFRDGDKERALRCSAKACRLLDAGRHDGEATEVADDLIGDLWSEWANAEKKALAQKRNLEVLLEAARMFEAIATALSQRTSE